MVTDKVKLNLKSEAFSFSQQWLSVSEHERDETLALLGSHPLTTSHHSWGMTGKNDSSLSICVEADRIVV